MSEKPAILVLQPHLGRIADMLEADFTVWRLWEGPPLEASHTIGAIVVAGEFSFDQALADSLPNLGLIACFTAGYDGVDLAWAAERGLKVSHSPGVNHEDVADHALALMLSAWKGLAEGDAIVREGRWRPTEKRISTSLGGRKLGIVGLGAIGEAVARRAATFGLEIAWWGPNQKTGAAWPRAASLLALAETSDILVVAAKASEESRRMVDHLVLEALGPHGLLVNVARGKLVDEAALIAALKDGRLGMAALDVFETEPTPADRWKDVPNVVLSPHTAGAASGALPKMVALTRENLRRFFAGEPLANPVIE